MTPRPARVLRVLVREALADALRRRLVLVVALASLLSLQLVDSCTSCGVASFSRDGAAFVLPDAAGIGALAVGVACALWTLLLAGMLASDQLTEPLADGSAVLLLARPVGRGRYALARLLGALAIALASGALLLIATGALLHAREGFAWWPVLPAFAACAAGAATVGALAMTASLYLPRLASLLLVGMGVCGIAAVNLAGLFGAQLGGLAAGVDRFGPPLLSAVAFALQGWIAPMTLPGDPLALALRHGVWLVASAALLVGAFRRLDLG